MANSTIAVNVQDLIGSDMDATVVVSYEEQIKNAFNYVLDLVPANSEIWVSADLESEDTTGSVITKTETDTTINDKKIVKITQQAGSITREVRDMDYGQYLKGTDPNSIYYHGKSVNNPVYTIGPDANILISPTPSSLSKATVYYVSYINTAISDKTDITLSDDTGYPYKLFYPGCIKSAINLIMAKVSDATQDEEDIELTQLLQAQLAALEKQFGTEMQRLSIPYQIIGVEDEAK